MIFGPKSGGTWPASVNLVGPQGATGATGPMPPIGRSNTQIQYNNNGIFAGSSNQVLDMSNNRLGIMPSSPTHTLHVNGNTRLGGLIIDANNSSGSTGQLLTRTLLGTGWADFPAEPWSTSGSNIYFNSGKVGIGTTSPTGLLTVDGGGAGTSFPAIRANNTNASGIALFASANSTDATLVVSQANTTAAGGVIAKFFSTGSYEVVKIGRIMEGFDAGGGIINLRGNNTATGGGFIFGHSTYGLVLGTFNAANDYYQVAGAYQPPTGNIVFMPWSYNNTDLGNSSFRWAAVYAVNGTIQTSDKNQKENIQDISYGLDAVMQLKPISYTWKDRSCSVGTGTNYGFIAQDLEKVIPDVVVHSITSHEEIENARKEKGIELDPETYGVKYSELIPVMVKAMQEQQEMIEHQQEMIDKQHIQMEFLQKQIDEMKRMIK